MVQPDPDNENTYRAIDIPSTLQAAKEPEVAILEDVERCGYCQDATFAIKLALEEAMTNAVKHGNGNDTSKRIMVRFAVTKARTVIIIRDQGTGFRPADIPDPTRPGRLTLPTGRGIMLNKTNGFRGLMRFLLNAYLHLTGPGGVPTSEEFGKIFKRASLADDDFNTDNFAST